MSTEPVQAAVSADIDAPDRVLYGLTARQVAILAAVAALLWVAYQALTPLVLAVAFAVAALPVGGLAVAVAVGRRDGISMDRWLAAGLTAARTPRRLAAAGGTVPAAPSWAPAQRAAAAEGSNGRGGAGPGPVAALRLPATAIEQGGTVEVDGGRVALTAAGTVNFDLRSAGEQHALIDGMGRWLNSLAQPVQIVVSTRRVDLYTIAEQVEDCIDSLLDPALADAAAGYAQFLRDLAADRDPLERQLLIAHQAGPHADARSARRAADHTARALTGLGAATRVLDGGQVTDALAAACDPWCNVGTGRAVPDAVITADPGGSLP